MQVQQFRKVRSKFRGRRSTFARSGPDFVAGTALSQGQARFRGRRSTFARSGPDFVAHAALFKVGHRFRGRHFREVRHRFVAGAAILQD